MKSKERSTIQSQIKTEDKTTSRQSGTTEKEVPTTAERIESNPSQLTLESMKNEDTGELKDHLETCSACSAVLTNIGNRQSKYLQDLLNYRKICTILATA